MTTSQTEQSQSYWDSTGLYQKEYDRLYSELVPSQGSSKTLNGELIRSIGRLYYEYYNNGNCNAFEQEFEEVEVSCHCGCDDECDECGGEGWTTEEEGLDATISSYYLQFIELIEKTVVDSKDIMKSIRKIILETEYMNTTSKFSDENYKSYNDMCDKVIEFVLKTEDTILPDWYVIDSI